MLLYNPTLDVINAAYGGMYSIFKPNEDREIFDSYAARHMLGRWGKYGLVALTYGSKEAKEYGDFEDYKHAKAIEDCQALVELLQSRLDNFGFYDEAFGERKNMYRQMQKKNAGIAEKLLKRAQEHLDKLLRNEGRATPEEKAKILRQQAKELEQKAARLLKGSNDSNSTGHAG